MTPRIVARLGTLALTAYFIFWFVTLTTVTCVIGALIRPFVGHRGVNTLKELLVGRGNYYAMHLIGAWNIEVRGDVLPGNERFVVVANHSSVADHVAMTFLRSASPTGEKKYLTKMAYFSLPIFGWLQWLAGDIGVDVTKERSRAESMARCRAALDGGSSIVIYPEGTRNKSPATLLPFKTGFARVAQECGVRVLPVAIHGAWRAGQGFTAGCSDMVLLVGRPITIEGRDDIPRAVEAARSWIQAAVVDLEVEQAERRRSRSSGKRGRSRSDDLCGSGEEEAGLRPYHKF